MNLAQRPILFVWNLSCGWGDAATNAWAPVAKRLGFDWLMEHGADDWNNWLYYGADGSCGLLHAAMRWAHDHGRYLVLAGCGHGNEYATTAKNQCLLIDTRQPALMERMKNHSMVQVSCSVRKGENSLINQLGCQSDNVGSTGVDIVYTFTLNGVELFVLSHVQQVRGIWEWQSWDEILERTLAEYMRQAGQAPDYWTRVYLLADGAALDLDRCTDRGVVPRPREEDGTCAVHIYAQDEDTGDAIPGADVVMAAAEDDWYFEGITDEGGHIIVSDYPRSTWSDIYITHPDYEEEHQRFYTDKEETTVVYQLTPVEEPPPPPPDEEDDYCALLAFLANLFYLLGDLFTEWHDQKCVK